MKTNNKITKVKAYLNKIALLCLTFFKIGALTFGGGYAMISIIDREAVTKRKWLSQEEMLYVIAISETTPGPISLNAATYVGAKVAGFLGAFLASISLMLPSIAVISVIALYLYPYFDNPYVQYAFLGMRAGVASLILNATVRLGAFLKKERNPIIWGIFFLTSIFGVLSAFKILKLDNIYLILGTILFAILYSVFRKHKTESKKVKTLHDPNGEEGGNDEHLL